MNNIYQLIGEDINLKILQGCRGITGKLLRIKAINITQNRIKEFALNGCIDYPSNYTLDKVSKNFANRSIGILIDMDML